MSGIDQLQREGALFYIKMVCLEVLRYHMDGFRVLHQFRDFSISNLEHLRGTPGANKEIWGKLNCF